MPAPAQRPLHRPVLRPHPRPHPRPSGRPVHRRVLRPTVLAAVLLSATALTACTGSDPESTSAPSRTATSAPATEPTEPTETASTDSGAEPSEPSEPSTSASSTTTSTASPTTAPASLRSRLLRAQDVPGFNQEFRWRAAGTRDVEPTRPFGTCQRFALSSIGATSVVTRGFRPVEASADSDSAGELVAQFPDATTARRAYAVLQSWRGRCADRLSNFDRVDVGDLQSVSAPGARAGWFLLTYGPVPGDPDSQWFDAQGMALKGDRIAMVEMILAGQDYNYDAGREPMVSAVRRAAGRL